ncbi:hypothetical protein A3K63_05095 [Candidatus Micrarchaeota archaeon RBG_16_49_10]|nr:MAG: hypothetical protein A3K63_05095 [Candidatus Micrarchaeota archaeon RBG_16_49_10]
MGKAAYALYYANLNPANINGSFDWVINQMFGNRGQWEKYLEAAISVRGDTKYSYSSQFPAPEKSGFVLVVGTYIPVTDVKKVLEKI